MSPIAAPRLLSTRNILGVVLVAGIAAGIYLGDLFKGPGLGGSSTTSQKTPGTEESAEERAKTVVSVDSPQTTLEETPTATQPVPDVVRIVIDDRSYLLRSTDGDQPSNLKDVVTQAVAAKGDTDGIRVRIYRRLSSRTSSEIALRDALVAAGVTEEQTAWIVNPID